MYYRVLGPLEVRDGERVLDLGRPKQRAVLAVLVLSGNHVVSLDRLIDLLWGDEAPTQATGSLQVYVSNLRRALEPQRRPPAPWGLLVTRQPGYCLTVGHGELDADRFECLAAEGRRLLGEGQPHAARAALVEALDLWHGDALADFVFDDFASPAAQRWEELRQLTTEDRIDADLALGNHGPAIGELEGLVARFPLRERLWSLLMIALYRSGRQGDALGAFTRAGRVLSDELGVEPSPELLRLRSDIAAHAESLAWRPSVAAKIPSTTRARPPEPSPVQTAARLVGREAQLAAFERALADARHSRGSMLLVAGEAGMGKTRFAEELAARATAEGALVAWGAGYESGGAPAFWPWSRVLRTVLDQADPADAAPALKSAAPWLAHLLPEVPAILGTPGAPPSLDAESARFRFYEAVVAALHVGAARRPLVVVLDDLHWADAPSLALCEFVAERLAGTRVLLAGTYRPGDVSADHPLAAALACFARQPRLTRVTLAGLSPGELSQFVAAITGTMPSDELVAALHARTDGNPFFGGEVVKLLQSEGSMTAPAIASAQIPVGVRDVLRRRLARLPESTNALLRVASVIGRDFGLDVLSAIIDSEQDVALEAVEAGIVIGIVTEHPAAVGQYRFSHGLVQETLYDELSAVRRARLHARVGAAIERLFPGRMERVAELAAHFYRAAAAIGPQKGIEYALQAADLSQAALAYEAVEDHLRRALGLVDRMEEGQERDRQELVVQNRLSLSIMMNGGIGSAEAEKASQRAAELALRLGETRELLLSMTGLSTTATVHGEWSIVSDLGAKMLALGEASGDALCQAAGHFALGNADVFGGRLDAGRDAIDKAILIARALQEQHPEVATLWLNPLVHAVAMRGMVLGLTGAEEAAAEATRDSLELAAATGFPFWSASAGFVSAIRSACERRAPEAGDQAEETAAIARANGVPGVAACASVIAVWAQSRDAAAPSDLLRMREALAACDQLGFRFARSLWLGLVADVCQQMGRWQEAIAAADDGLVECRTTGERFYEAELYRLRGDALAASGAEHAAAARASLCQAASIARSQGAVLFARRAAASLAQLAEMASR